MLNSERKKKVEQPDAIIRQHLLPMARRPLSPQLTPSPTLPNNAQRCEGGEVRSAVGGCVCPDVPPLTPRTPAVTLLAPRRSSALSLFLFVSRSPTRNTHLACVVVPARLCEEGHTQCWLSSPSLSVARRTSLALTDSYTH